MALGEMVARACRKFGNLPGPFVDLAVSTEGPPCRLAEYPGDGGAEVHASGFPGAPGTGVGVPQVLRKLTVPALTCDVMAFSSSSLARTGSLSPGPWCLHLTETVSTCVGLACSPPQCQGGQG